MNNIILEDGYNTDYIYSLIIALFCIPTEGISKIINQDTNNTNTYYVQEYIKAKFIYPLNRNISIESMVINKLRIFLYNCGWLKNNGDDLLNRSDLNKFYTFLISGMMDYKLNVIKIDPQTNEVKNDPIDLITITDKHFCADDKNVVNLSTLVERWADERIVGDQYSYKFDPPPFIVPVYLDIRDNQTNLNKKMVNIMEGLNFNKNGDKLQRMFIWEFHSLICRSKEDHYYTIIADNNNNMIAFSDKRIPSNWKIDMSDKLMVKKIMQEVVFVFYKLH